MLLAKQRHRRRTLHAAGRAWGRLLDITVGYGYRPWRAGIWLLALTLLGTLVFRGQHPVARNPADGPVFHALPYTLDLLTPIGASASATPGTGRPAVRSGLPTADRGRVAAHDDGRGGRHASAQPQLSRGVGMTSFLTGFP
ncbi:MULTISPECIES: hypothetical protein [Streptomyces]|uniref:hypothetical protein n=1 Tax=Streptomyces TaxID=1883 RepID=UPI001F0C161A|nr:MULTISPECIES: hypothetical protein [Streptomyces]